MAQTNHVSCNRLARTFISLCSHKLVWLMSDTVGLTGQTALKESSPSFLCLSHKNFSHTSLQRIPILRSRRCIIVVINQRGVNQFSLTGSAIFVLQNVFLFKRDSIAVCPAYMLYFLFLSIGEITQQESLSAAVHSSMSFTIDHLTYCFSPRDRFVFNKQEQ